jgi:ubiquinone biosynthesis protein
MFRVCHNWYGAGRLNEVVGVLVRFGVAPWLQSIHAEWVQRQLRAKSGDQIGGLSQAAKIRLAFTELGTTFIKVGDILSTRADLFAGPELAVELATLQSRPPADEPKTVLATVEQELAGQSVGYSHSLTRMPLRQPPLDRSMPLF